MRPLTLEEIARAVDGRLNDPSFAETIVTAVSTDTRKEMDGALFVPIAGETYDGHAFINDAYNKGAVCCLSHEDSTENRPVIRVDDTRRALLALAAYYKGLFNVKTVAVTGSTGKTTTKDLIASVLSRRFKVLKTPGNLNNEIGLPLTIFNLESEHWVLVVEMGMNAPGEIRRLSLAARPDAAVITNIGVAHMEKLGSKEAILEAKLEILEGMPPGGQLFFNGDDEFLREAAEELEGYDITFFGIGAENDVIANDIEKCGIRGIAYELCHKEEELRVEVPVPGAHMAYNSLAAAAVGFGFGFHAEEIKDGIADFKPSEFRLNITENRHGVTVIDDAYNANPDSVRAALDVLTEAPGRKICVLGDMLELGPESAGLHYEAGRYAAELDIDVIICVGEKAAKAYEGAFSEIERAGSFSQAARLPDKASAIEYLEEILEKGDTVLVKASRAMAFEEITKELFRN